MRLQDKVAIITGGANGQGACEAGLFASEGAKVIVADIREDLGTKVVSDIEASGGIAEFVSLDVREDKQWESLVERTLKKFTKIDPKPDFSREQIPLICTLRALFFKNFQNPSNS